LFLFLVSKSIHHSDVAIHFRSSQSARGKRKDGLYDLVEKLAGPEMEKMLDELQTAPAVPVLPPKVTNSRKHE